MCMYVIKCMFSRVLQLAGTHGVLKIIGEFLIKDFILIRVISSLCNKDNCVWWVPVTRLNANCLKNVFDCLKYFKNRHYFSLLQQCKQRNPHFDTLITLK